MSWHGRAGGWLPRVSTDVPWQGQPERSGWDVAGDASGRAALEKPRREQRVGGPSPRCLQVPNLAQPPPLAFWGSRRVRKESCPCQTTHPFPQLPGAPVCPAAHAGLLLPSCSKREQFIVCSAQEGNCGGRGGLLIEDEASAGPAAGKSLPSCLCRVRRWGLGSLKPQSSVQQDALISAPSLLPL